MSTKIQAYVQKFGTHGTKLSILNALDEPRLVTPKMRVLLEEMLGELAEALEEVLHIDPTSGH